MRRISLILVFVVALIAVACELIVDVDVPIDEYRLVLNGLVKPDEMWNIDLHRERHILDQSGSFGQPGFTIVADAEVVISDDVGNEVARLEFEGPSRHYRSTGYPEPGKTYHITVSAPGYTTISASTTVPMPVTFEVEWDSVNQVPPSQWRPGGYPVAVTINDPAGVKNYYEVQLLTERVVHLGSVNGEPIIDTVFTEAYFYSDDPLYNEENGGFGMIDDRFFDGQRRVIQYVVPPGCCDNTRRIGLAVVCYNEEYYKYIATLRLQREISFDPFAQPVVVFNNIVNGLGVFGAATTTYIEWTR